jgi:hypothetical protein
LFLETLNTRYSLGKDKFIAILKKHTKTNEAITNSVYKVEDCDEIIEAKQDKDVEEFINN